MPDATSASPKTYQCRHLFTDGHRCGSKSLRNEQFCFYHHKTRKPFPKAAPAPPAETVFDLPFPEDRAAIQLSIGEVLQRIARNEIDPRRAGLLLYGLQIASLNLPPHPKQAAGRPHSTRTRGRRRHNETPQPEESQPIEIYEIHPDYGDLAPIAEYTAPEEELSFVGKLLRQLGEDDDPPEEAVLPTLQAVAEPPSGAPSLAAPLLRVGLLANSLLQHQSIVRRRTRHNIERGRDPLKTELSIEQELSLDFHEVQI